MLGLLILSESNMKAAFSLIRVVSTQNNVLEGGRYSCLLGIRSCDTQRKAPLGKRPPWSSSQPWAEAVAGPWGQLSCRGDIWTQVGRQVVFVHADLGRSPKTENLLP